MARDGDAQLLRPSKPEKMQQVGETWGEILGFLAIENGDLRKTWDSPRWKLLNLGSILEWFIQLYIYIFYTIIYIYTPPVKMVMTGGWCRWHYCTHIKYFVLRDFSPRKTGGSSDQIRYHRTSRSTLRGNSLILYQLAVAAGEIQNYWKFEHQILARFSPAERPWLGIDWHCQYQESWFEKHSNGRALIAIPAS